MDRVIDNEQVIYERTRHYLPGDWKLFLATTLNLTFFLFTGYIVSSSFRFYIGIGLLDFVSIYGTENIEVVEVCWAWINFLVNFCILGLIR